MKTKKEVIPKPEYEIVIEKIKKAKSIKRLKSILKKWHEKQSEKMNESLEYECFDCFAMEGGDYELVCRAAYEKASQLEEKEQGR